MAQNYNLNSNFGFNVTPKGAPNQTSQQQEVIEQKKASIFDSVASFFEKNEEVFSGDVQKEINMYSRQAMIIGMNLKASDKNVRRFDMNI